MENYLRRPGILLALLIFFGCSGSAVENSGKPQAAESREQQSVPLVDSFVSFTADPKNVRLFWKDSSGKILGSLGALKSFVEEAGKTLRFAMNGGMYTEDQQPLGLFIADGKMLRRLNRDTGYGNFYLQPNGVFYITKDGEAVVCRTQDLPAEKSIRWATQSGPMLLTDGRFHPAFKKGSANVNVRNGVGILPDGQVLFAITNVPVNLYDFASYFKAKGCRNALYLDGFVSRAYYPEKGFSDKGGTFGVMIGTVD